MFLLVVATVWQAQAATCTSTGFSNHSPILTAALINPKTVSGEVDATGCNIGIYYGPNSKGHINGANIHGANYFGVVNNGGDVHVTNSTISDIGEKPFNGTQHGVAVYFAFNSASQGEINGNFIWNYQKGGIVVNGTKGHVDISHNTVLGQGPVNYIAQNGIQVGYGANADAHDNMVVGNSYTGPNQAASGGILVVGGDCYGGPLTTGTRADNNVAIGNDVGVWFSNLDLDVDDMCVPATTPTKGVASQNDIVNNGVNNTTGNGPTQGYQAGISDQGNGDVIMNNNICGLGYIGTPPAADLFTIDVTFTNSPVVKNNTICGVGSKGGSGANLEMETSLQVFTVPTQLVLPSVIQ